jgi:hypothetical protein
MAWKAPPNRIGDIYGAGSNGRSFDFNIFPTKSSPRSRCKTSSADVEEEDPLQRSTFGPASIRLRGRKRIHLHGRGVYNSV